MPKKPKWELNWLGKLICWLIFFSILALLILPILAVVFLVKKISQ